MDNLEQFKKAAIGMGYEPGDVEAFAALVAANPRSTVTGMTPAEEAKYTTQQAIQNQADIEKAKALQPVTIQTEVEKKKATAPIDIQQTLETEKGKVKQTMSDQFNDLENKVNNVEAMVSSLEATGMIGGTFGKIVATVTGGKKNPNIKAYEAIKNSLKSPLARVLGGEKGNLSDKDIARMGILPEVTDDPEVARRKINYIRTVISQGRATYGIPESKPTQLDIPKTNTLSSTPNLQRDQITQKLKGAGYTQAQIDSYLKAKGL